MNFSLTDKSELTSITDFSSRWYMTSEYFIAGTETFRLASKPLLPGFTRGQIGPLQVGGNLQNLKKEWRVLFRAKPGYRLIQTDQSGAEALIVAYECVDGNYRALFKHNVKPHVFIALHNFGEQLKRLVPELASAIDDCKLLKIAELKTHPQWAALDKSIKKTDENVASERYYYIGKLICHASNYGMTEYAFQMHTLTKSDGSIVLNNLQCKKYLDTYHCLFPEIRQWHRSVIDQLRKNRTLTNFFDYPRLFTSYLDFNGDLKDAYAFGPQSTVGVVTHNAVIKLQDFIEKENRDWSIITNTHDSYLCQAPETDIEECSFMMKQFMNQKLVNKRGEELQMQSSTSIGSNWGSYKKGKNEEGLQEI